MNDAALLIIELQNDLCHPDLATEDGLRGALARAVARRGLLDKIPPIVEAARAAGVHVIYATKEREPAATQPAFPPIFASAGEEPILVHGTPGADIVEQVAPHASDTVLARLHGVSPGADDTLWTTLGTKGVTTLIVCGISTTFAVEGTVRAAVDRGLHVIVLEDCCAGVPQTWHDFSIDNVMPLLAEVIPGADLLDRLRTTP